jgi:uncharacterized membrane protein
MRQQSTNGNWDSAEAHNDQDDRLANGLGMFSLGLGLAEVTAPGALAKFIGVNNDEKSRTILRSYGAREIGTGLGILAQKRPAGWMWGRVGGDMLDIATLAAAMSRPEADRAKIGRAIAMVLGVTALDVYCAQNLSNETAVESDGDTEAGIPVIRVITINKSPEEVYAFWRNFENLPRFMAHLEAVHTFGDHRSHWVAKAPGGTTAEWDAEVVDEIPGRMIAWRSLEGAEVDNSGCVRFERATGGRGTVVNVELRYNPPGGAIGGLFAKLFGEDPGQQIAHDLRSLKQILEVGEVVNSDASIHDRMHPAQPPAHR